MRLFTGISVEHAVIPRLAELHAAATLKWTPPTNLHITTKFIGEWPDGRLTELKAALAGVARPEALTITVMGFECFPGGLFAAVANSASLFTLHRATEDALEPLGCARETRPWWPHITLARLNGPVPAGLRETIASMDLPGHSDPIPSRARKGPVSDVSPQSSNSFVARNFHLYLSRPGSLYTKLATYP